MPCTGRSVLLHNDVRFPARITSFFSITSYLLVCTTLLDPVRNLLCCLHDVITVDPSWLLVPLLPWYQEHAIELKVGWPIGSTATRLSGDWSYKNRSTKRKQFCYALMPLIRPKSIRLDQLTFFTCTTNEIFHFNESSTAELPAGYAPICILVGAIPFRFLVELQTP